MDAVQLTTWLQPTKVPNFKKNLTVGCLRERRSANLWLDKTTLKTSLATLQIIKSMWNLYTLCILYMGNNCANLQKSNIYSQKGPICSLFCGHLHNINGEKK